MRKLLCILLAFSIQLPSLAQQSTSSLKDKVAELPKLASGHRGDWLTDKVTQKSGVYSTEIPGELCLDNGLLRRRFLVTPNLASVGLEELRSERSVLRDIRPEAKIVLDGMSYDVGGLQGQPVRNFLLPKWYGELRATDRSFVVHDMTLHPITPRFPWKARQEWIANPVDWPPDGIEVRFHFLPPPNDHALQGLRLTVHYELYDGLPLICKWMSVVDDRDRHVRVTNFTSEILACVEASSQVEDLAEPFHPNIHVETDFTSVSMQGASSQREVVWWTKDPEYSSQVNYRLESQCLLECRPPLGPDVELQKGVPFETFRTWILLHENRDEVRQTLALNRMYKTIAPWVVENPMIHHVRSALPKDVRLAIDQCSEVGFELVIMTFGSGFDIENRDPAYRGQIRELAEYAHSKGIALGGYSLLASRSIGPAEDVVNPDTGKPGGFARFGNSPCLESRWGQDYFDNLYAFYESTGCDVLEHDGSYPGDACASQEHPGHRGYADSRWKQWRKITNFYRWCRGKGIYLNVPDWYFLNGSNKNGMGYRETNWSLPRDYQELIERQNIHDGTQYKLPTMGWMFVPLTEYHGGGADATIEPLDDHLDHYERRLQNLFGAGVQACFRGPRLYDSDRTKEMVRKWVNFYRDHRAILDSSLIPLRRADGRDWDGWLHVAPELDTPALAMVYNPLPIAIDRNIRIPLYYSGIRGSVRVSIQGKAAKEQAIDAQGCTSIAVQIPERSAIWITFCR